MAAAPWPAVWWKPALPPVRSLPLPASTPAARFLNGKLGLTQAEAVMDLISADGRQGAALANAALGGALAKEDRAPRSRRLPPFRHTLPHGWIFPRRMCRSWTVTTCTAY